MENTLGKRIMQNRKRLGLTQDQLAEKLGVTAQAVSKWENDQSCPDITMIPLLAEIFGITTDELLGREASSEILHGTVCDADNGEKRKNFRLTFGNTRKAGLGTAVYVIFVGLIYLLSVYFVWDISFWTIAWTSALLIFGLFGLYPHFSFLSLGCVLLGGYSLYVYLFPTAHAINGKLIFAAAVLLCGFSLLVNVFRKSRKPLFELSYNDADGNEHKTKTNNDYDVHDGVFDYSGSFGSNRQLVEVNSLREGNISTSFGEFTVDLSGVKSVDEGAAVNADCSFGELTILVPSRYQVKCESSTSFAGFDVQGRADDVTEGMITLKANASFGEIRLLYV